MPDHSPKYSAADLLNDIPDEGFTEGRGGAIAVATHENQQPLYVSLLTVFGGLLFAAFFILFMSLSHLINFSSGPNLIVWGFLFTTGAIGLQRYSDGYGTKDLSFAVNISFSIITVGKLFVIAGVFTIFDSGWGITLGLISTTALTYFIYNVSVDRFISSFSILMSILVNLLNDPELAEPRAFLLNGFFFVQLAGCLVLFTHKSIKADYRPIAYAFALTLCVTVLFLVTHRSMGYWDEKALINPVFMNTMLAGALIALYCWAAGGIEKLEAEPLVLVFTGSVLLGVISAPGILLAIQVLILGYARHESPLLILGALFTPVFLWLFYYNLDLTLLQKSGVLAISGLTLLAGAVYIKYRGWASPGFTVYPGRPQNGGDQ